MNIADIIARRNYGELQISFCSNWKSSLDSLLSSFGLIPNQQKLKQICQEDAKKNLAALFWRDLAYNDEIMPEQYAHQYAQYLIRTAAPQPAAYYTNADWYRYHGSTSFEFTSFTSATFDGGVLCVGTDTAMCVWVQDED